MSSSFFGRCFMLLDNFLTSHGDPLEFIIIDGAVPAAGL